MNRTFICLAVGLLFSLAGKAQFKKHDNIKFDFRVEKLSEYKETIKIYGTLHNPNADTVYLLTLSCDGMQYSLQYDSIKFFLSPMILCNASWPIVAKIPPKGKLDFTAHFKILGKSNEIKLGFDLYELEKWFDKDDPVLDTYFRKKRSKNIIWANVHSFE
jgi:hypothetical protein